MHEVIAAITTAPWSSTPLPPSANVDLDRVGRAARRRPCAQTARAPRRRSLGAAGSDAGNDSSFGLVDAVLHRLDVVVQRLAEHRLGRLQRHAVLRALRAGERRLDGRQVELERLGERRLDRRVVPEAVLLGVGLDQRDLVVLAAGEAQVAQRLVVDREDRAGRAVLGAHVADGGAVGQRHGADARAVELDELADDAVLAQHLGDREDEVGGGRAVGQFAGELEADDAGDEHADRLAEHRGLGLDAADAPAEHAEAVDHRGVRVGADERVGVGQAVAGEHDAGEVLDVDLVHDAGARRHDLELVERGLAPAQELVALEVALVLEFDVALERVGRAEQVGDDRVVDDQLGRRQRVDLGRVAAELDDGLAHRGEVDDGGHAGEVLHDDAGGGELDLGVRLGVGRQLASASIWAAVTFAPSSVRSRFSSSTFRLNGSRSAPSTAARREDVVALARRR